MQHEPLTIELKEDGDLYIWYWSGVFDPRCKDDQLLAARARVELLETLASHPLPFLLDLRNLLFPERDKTRTGAAAVASLVLQGLARASPLGTLSKAVRHGFRGVVLVPTGDQAPEAGCFRMTMEAYPSLLGDLDTFEDELEARKFLASNEPLNAARTGWWQDDSDDSVEFIFERRKDDDEESP